MWDGKATDFRVNDRGTLWLKDRICVPQDQEIHTEILREAHNSKYAIHTGCMKMYQDLKDRFWWNDMRTDIAEFVAKCDICRRIKAEHQRPAGLLKPLDIPVWKGDDICMDFITGLPQTQKVNDSIWVIVDRLTKVAHFIPVKTTCTVSRLSELYVENILKLHEAPRSIVSDRDPQFTAKF
jgi:hypothetical protein